MTVPKVQMVLVNSLSGELDKVEVEVRDTTECGREIMAALSREQWVLSVGDRIEIRDPNRGSDANEIGY